MTKIRLQVALARSGVASRRKSAKLIESGRIKVNGNVICEPGYRVDAREDTVVLDKKPVSLNLKEYCLLNKPRGVLSTVRDERGRKTVLSYIKDKNARFYPVGRLDKNTTGLIILTNDGDLTYRLTHPKFRIDRVYEAKVDGEVLDNELSRIKAGIIIDGKKARPENITLKKRSKFFTCLSVTLKEGRKREVRRLFESVGHEVLELKRVSYGPLGLKGLKEGSVRPLGEDEVLALRRCVGLER